ncbi:hypothetical protein GCM10010435_03970 [Winogradskya consettensis]|uniref:DUF5666 domain-containing protein n=1 Tax=Winogradskya consettensis TaxID=113560 RepID=A0A919T109_9ACTN|nr:hypothetical protein [Actinoplanes consettensis]GIM81783.1 hypothetical protein Aco04nite_78300 [Actinoplanes consettensis]
MTRSRIAFSLGLAGLLALAGCGAAPTTADVAAETYALTAMDAPSASPSEAAAAKPRRAYLRKNTLHGEITVQVKEGTRTVVVQRGTVTATDAKTLSVKSSDGFTQTWTLGDKAKVQGTLKTGAEVGVAGRKDGDATVARLVRVK